MIRTYLEDARDWAKNHPAWTCAIIAIFIVIVVAWVR